MEFKIELKGLDEFKRKLADLKSNQLPYAAARALTKTAQDVQKKVIEQLPSQFTLRTKWYTPQSPLGFRVTNATKQKWEATVGTIAPFMLPQESGGIRVAIKGKKYIAVPTENVRRSKSDLIKDSDRPAYLLRGYTVKGTSKRKGTGRQAAYTGVKAFIGTIKGVLGIWLRGEDHTIKLMYVLVPDVKLEARLHFMETAKKVVDEKWQQNANDAIAEAIRTAK